MAQLIEGVPANERIRISVCDTGIGIPPALHQAIFTEYYQVGNPERDRTKGLGLGLAIVDRLVRLLGHDLAVDSEAGKGSRFKLDVPVGRMVAGLPAAGQMLPEAGELLDMHVIVIDDEQLVREGMDKLLQTWGCTTVLAGDAEEALALIADTGRMPDAIVADYRLREHRTGAEAIALVRARCGQAIPALLITGDTAPERLREAQATDLPLMHKPVSPVRLRGYLRQVRAQSRAD
jgi:CheY-like chemotaxis protein